MSPRLPGSEQVLVKDGPRRRVRLGRDPDRIINIFCGRTGCAAAWILEAVSRPADPAERPECARSRAELGGDGLLDSKVAASAGGTQPLSFEQASGTLPEGVISQLVSTGHVVRRLRGRRGGDMATRIRQQPTGDLDVRGDGLDFGVIN